MSNISIANQDGNPTIDINHLNYHCYIHRFHFLFVIILEFNHQKFPLAIYRSNKDAAYALYHFEAFVEKHSLMPTPDGIDAFQFSFADFHNEPPISPLEIFDHALSDTL